MVKCCNCNWQGEENKLEQFDDSSGGGFGCPNCKTDHHLTEDDNMQKPERDEKNQNKCPRCSRIVGCDEMGETKECDCKIPYKAQQDRDELAFRCPNLTGSCMPDGYKEIDRLFVDKGGFGSPDEPALTAEQFLDNVKAGLHYAIVEEGQFQLYVGVFECEG